MYLSKRTCGLITGTSVLVMAVIAMFSYGYIFEKLIVKNNGIETFNNLKSAYGVFVAGIFGWGIIFFLDVLVACFLYFFFKDLNYKISLFSSILRILYSFGLAYASLHLLDIVPLLSGNIDNHEAVLLKLKAFELMWVKSLIIFGFHLIGLGVVLIKLKSNFNKFGYLIIFSGLCYVLLNLLKISLPLLGERIMMVELILSLPMAMAEIGLGFWLIIKGGSTPEALRKELLV
ncbi:DUF4386 domain-containing protein [Cyclobacterium marinum]|uniref:DUF4386 domain-containing protein n=1 Tax=Cyclobacterium marinum TaxID=104 RepID=UPI0011EFE6BC|nr:DUF4386 domain-containing protein [Cyclobacterium marinum]MBI0399581.1 DUF4386 domain-containing protein [Cyclobacterium marinum]